MSGIFQTSNLIINLDHEEFMLDNNDACLADLGIGIIIFNSRHICRIHDRAWLTENETEVSFFNQAAYEAFKRNPEVLHQRHKSFALLTYEGA